MNSRRSPTMTLTLTSSLLKDAAFLADAAYQDGFKPASVNLIGSQWDLVGPGSKIGNVQFNLPAFYFDPSGFYSVGLPGLGFAEAIVAYDAHTNTLALSFRGTELLDILGRAADVVQFFLNAYYNALTPLMTAVESFAANIGASVL